MDHGCGMGARAGLIRWTGGSSVEARGGGDVTGRDPCGAHALLSQRPRRLLPTS
jgi:hypothetical protein